MPSERTVQMLTDSSGRRIFVEVSDTSGPVSAAGSAGYTPATSLVEQFQSLEDAIDNTCNVVLAGITRLAKASAPSKVSAEFAFELGAQGKVWFIAQGSAKAAVKLTLDWDLERAPSLKTS